MPHEGGKYQYTLSVINALKTLPDDKYIIYVVFTKKHWKGIIPNSMHQKEIKYTVINKLIRGLFLKLSFFFSTELRVWRRIGKFIDRSHKEIISIDPDLVIYPTNSSLAYEIDKPSVAPIFDLMHIYEPCFPEVKKNNLIKKRNYHYSLICKYSKIILVDSKVGKDHVLENFNIRNTDAIKILPYAAPGYIKISNPDKSILNKFDLPKKFLLYPAQFWKHKNHKGLLEGIKHLKDKQVYVNLVLVGSNKNVTIAPYINRLALKKQVYLLNYVTNDELVALYKCAVALVMPTFFGPTNIPQLEAFALGCPVITSNIYGIPEQVGGAALLVNPADNIDIANKIAMVWDNEDLRLELIKKGYIRNSHWSLNEFSKKLQSIVKLTVE